MGTTVILSRILEVERYDCSTCGAEPPWRCTTRSGRNTKPHQARVDAWLDATRAR